MGRVAKEPLPLGKFPPLHSVGGRGGGVLGNRISCLKTPPELNFEKGGLGGGFKGVFRCAGVLSAVRAPRPRVLLSHPRGGGG